MAPSRWSTTVFLSVVAGLCRMSSASWLTSTTSHIMNPKITSIYTVCLAFIYGSRSVIVPYLATTGSVLLHTQQHRISYCSILSNIEFLIVRYSATSGSVLLHTQPHQVPYCSILSHIRFLIAPYSATSVSLLLHTQPHQVPY